MNSNKLTTKTSILISTLFILSACCTKQACLGDPLPEITIQFNTRQTFTLYLAEKNAFSIKDSINLQYKKSIIISDYTFREKSNDIRDYSYIIKTQLTSDTISKVSYTVETETIECNECILGKDYQDISVYNNFRYQHKGLVHQGNDTLVIKN